MKITKVLVWLFIFVLVPSKQIKSTSLYSLPLSKFPIETIEMPTWSPNEVGKVVCSDKNVPVIIIRSDSLEKSEKEFVLIHERVHVSQFLFDCTALRKRYRNNKAFRQKIELEAYCKDGEARVKKGWRKNEVISRVRGLLKTYHGIDSTRVVCSWF